MRWDMAKRADIVLEQNSTRVVNDLVLADGPSTDPTVEVDVSRSRVSIGGGKAPTNGSASGALSVRNASGDTLVGADATAQGGTVSVLDASGSTQVAGLGVYSSGDGLATVDGVNGDGGVTLSGANDRGSIEVRTDNGNTVATVESTNPGATLELSENGGDTRVRAEAFDGGGMVSVTGNEGVTTATLHGDDSTLELVGQPEPGVETERERRRFGGGEVIIANGREFRDPYVHLNGDRNSKYGLGRGLRPRVYVNGPEADIEAGRAARKLAGSDEELPAVDGSVRLRDTFGTELVTINAQSPTHSQSDRHVAEIVLDHGTPNGVQQGGGGAIRAVGDGLMFYVAGQEALYITNTGEILTAGEIHEGTL